MHRIIRRRIRLAVLAAFPIVSPANVSETIVLPANMAINLETGASSSSGGDLLWNGSTIAPVGGAKIRNLGKIGITNFNGLTESYWVEVAGGAKATRLAENLVVSSDVFAAVTNGGHTAKPALPTTARGIRTLRSLPVHAFHASDFNHSAILTGAYTGSPFDRSFHERIRPLKGLIQRSTSI